MKLQFVGEIRKDNTIKLPALQRRALKFNPGQQVYVTLVKLPRTTEEQQNVVRKEIGKD